MKTVLLALVVGCAGGVLGAWLQARYLDPAATGSAAAGGVERADADLLARVEALEAGRGLRQEAGARLEGRGDARALAVADLVEDGESLEALGEAVLREIDPSLKERVRASLEELEAEKAAEAEGRPGRQRRPRMPLADVAREIGLSAAEEDELRRIYDDTTQKLYEVMAKPDGDVEQVKRDLDAFKNKPEERPKLITKYMPKMLSNIGEFMGIEAERSTRVREAVGDERASELERFDIVEANPLDMSATFGMETRNR